MSKEDLVPLPADVTSLIDADRADESVPVTSRQRTMRRLEWTIASSAGGPGSGGTPGGDTPTLGSAEAGASAAAGGLTKTLAVGLVTFALGGAAGAGLHATLSQPPPPPMLPISATDTSGDIVVPEVAPSVYAHPRVEVPERTEPAPPVAPVTGPTAASTETPAAQRDTDLAEERAILVDARSALSAGNPKEALAAVDRHASRFPS